ncbi:DUF4169 family protein [Lichenicoccus sp.]|uniref:DUF4169 family protein n=1 Tax=Lichenicoccus sp. TaxID=2781899 RepID=UPI003D0B7C49
MAEIVNLKRARKRAARAEAADAAAQNRVRFGRTLVEQAGARLAAKTREALLDGKRLTEADEMPTEE